jgi:hypothetical protein
MPVITFLLNHGRCGESVFERRQMTSQHRRPPGLFNKKILKEITFF